MARNSNTQREAEARQERAISLRADGRSYEDISSELNVGVQEAIDLVKEQPERTQTLAGVRMEAFFVQNRINTRGRIEELSSLRQRLSDELARRDLTDLPTDKLVTLLIKTNEALKGEVTTPTIFSTAGQAKAERDRNMWDNF